jgi:hypothetical protein
LLAVAHPLHAHEHHRGAWQHEEKWLKLNESEPMPGQSDYGGGRNRGATENQAASTDPAARALIGAVTGRTPYIGSHDRRFCRFHLYSP